MRKSLIILFVVMYINGELAEDIKISGAMDVVGLVINFIT